ncbi:uncharacterized protein LOC127253290 [Andrographis paniculata]|uniref:uncharacterized protein LOC127253290 n=1 Tax=Andrographis paniculata TaxID=175694 RepID=UPI0021E74C86|nr:uncharacterized protein LOC127253290 [Andrographis paniculata]
MKWGRRRNPATSSSQSAFASPPPPPTSSSSSSSSSIIKRVFRGSWFSRFRQKSSFLSETNSASSDNKINKHHHLTTAGLLTPNASLPDGRVYSMDEDDAYWRISFSQERVIHHHHQQGRRSTGGINPLWYDDSDPPDFELLPANSRLVESQQTRKAEEEVADEQQWPKFSDMVSDIKKMKEKWKLPAQTHGDAPAPLSIGRNGVGGGSASLNGQGWGNELRHNYRDGVDEERVILPIELGSEEEEEEVQMKGHRVRTRRRTPNTTSASSSNSSSRKQPTLHHPNSVSWPKNRSRGGGGEGCYHYSPRPRPRPRPRPECKIRALEEMKIARIKCKDKKAKTKNGAVMEEERVPVVFDSFAVVKSSYDPQRDFRESMVEMIREQGLWRPQDLEELLTCYLTLNDDDYHDLIIKVFRQVCLSASASASTRRRRSLLALSS